MAGRLIPSVSSAETWRQVYQQFQNINFTAFDFNAIKQSALDYMKTYFPEIFNDFIESDEFIAWMELFAYIGELMAYRVDIDAHENLLPVAQRTASVLRLAKFVSYKSSRNITARGLVKMISIRTTEQVVDGKGNVLTNKNIVWNDPTNPDWKEQFILVINRALTGSFGTVAPSDRVQVQDVLFELYTFNNNSLPNGVLPYTVTVSNTGYDFELVPTTLTQDGPIEARPQNNSQFTVLYASDGLGDGSSTTGFLMYTKQGTLTQITQTFDGITPNQTFDVGANNINETDLWLNQINPKTGNLVDDGSQQGVPSGEWISVNISNTQNIIFNTNKLRNKYEVENLENDDVRFIFGDGEFANIPNGTFNIWYRVSANADITVPQNSISGTTSSFTYQDSGGNSQTLTFQFSLTGPIQNSSPTEDIEHIRRTAPAVYYTQDRMVNGADYNLFMLQDPTILKLRAINRTFAGESNYISFNDPSEAYNDVKIFGNDLALFYNTDDIVLQNQPPALSGTYIVENIIQPLLSDATLYSIRVARSDSNPGRKVFTQGELDELPYTLGDTTPTHPIPLPTVGFPVYFVHDVPTDTWLGFNSNDYNTIWLVANPTNPYYFVIANTNPTVTPWQITHAAATLFADSEVTKFWFANTAPVVDYNTLDPSNDYIAVLSANVNADRDGVLPDNQNLIITGQAQYLNTGMVNIHRLTVVPSDSTNNGFPTDVLLTPLLNPTIEVENDEAVPASYTVYVSGRASANGSTGLPAPTSGFTVLDVNGDVVTDTPTGIPNDTTNYRFSVEIDQNPIVNSYPLINGNQPLKKFYVAQNIASSISTYRKFSITDSSGGAIDGTYTIQNFQFVGGTSGFQIANLGGSQIESNPTGLAEDIPATAGYQTIAFSTGKTAGDLTGLANSGAVYTAKVDINSFPLQTHTVHLAVIGSTAQTFAALIGVIQTQLGNLAFIEQINGNLQITSASTGNGSTIAVTNEGSTFLFANPDLLGINNNPVSWTAVPGVAAAPTVYTARVTIDGGSPQDLLVPGGQAQTFTDFFSNVNGQLVGGTSSLIDGNVFVTSNTVGPTSTVLIEDIPFPIVSASSITETFVISGDWTSTFRFGIQFNVVGAAAGNDGLYTTISSVFGAGLTTITVSPNVTTTQGPGGTVEPLNVFSLLDGFTAFSTPVAGTNTLGMEIQVYEAIPPYSPFITTIVSASSVTDTFVIAGDQTAIFSPGKSFTVNGTPFNNGTYLTVSSSFGGGNTTIQVAFVTATQGAVGTIYVGALFPFTVISVITGFGGTWTISGNHASEFIAGQSLTVSANSGTGDGIYTVLSATNVGPNTNIIVTESISPGATGDGVITTFNGTLNYHEAATKLSFNVSGIDMQTYGSLVAALNVGLQSTALARIIDGNVQINSNTTGFLSKVNVTNYADATGVIQALATALVETPTQIYSGDTEGVDPEISMVVTIGGTPTTVSLRMSQAQTYQDFANTILSQLPATPPVEITFPSGNMKFSSLVTAPPLTVGVSFIGTWDTTYLGHIPASDTSITGTYGTLFPITVVPVPGGPGVGTWKLAGNVTASFSPGQTFVVSGNTGGGDGTYTVFSDTFVFPNTEIVVNETVPIGATADGTLTLLGVTLVNVPIYYIQGRAGDVTVTGDLGFPITFNSTAPYNINNTIQNVVQITNFNGNNSATVEILDYAYFYQADAMTETVPIPPTPDNLIAFINDTAATNTNEGTTYSRAPGRSGLNFFWSHKTRSRHLIDPAATNIIDSFIIQRVYYTNYKNWLAGLVPSQPAAPTPFELRNTYGYLLDNRMLSDTAVLQSGQFKVLFGTHADPSLQATITIVPSSTTSLTVNQIKNTVIQTVQNYFEITSWEFGETFYFPELAAAIQNALPADLNAVVLVPLAANDSFGDMYQVDAGDNEVFIPDITVNQIQIVTSLSPSTLRQSSS